jgi:hypothetical protein
MSNKKSLFVGCSFTADSGFTVDNQSKYHWPQLVCQHTGHEIVNRAISGMSNHEIFLRTIEAITADNYDLVVIMWSEVSRLWAYNSDLNVDDFTILNSGIPKGFKCLDKSTKWYAQLHYAHFNNQYVNIKNWLLYCLALEKMLKIQNLPYVFIKGFDNYVNDFAKVTYTNGFNNVENLKDMLDFENRPDNYILKKIKVIQDLIQAQDQSRWLNLYGLSFSSMEIDLADDSAHPGPKTNLQLATDFIKFYKYLND